LAYELFVKEKMKNENPDKYRENYQLFIINNIET